MTVSNTLQEEIPHLTRSSLHRCLQRYGISRLPKEEKNLKKKKFKSYPIGYFHIDIAEVQTEEGKLYLFVAIDRTSKFAYAKLHLKQTKTIAAEFLKELIEKVPYRIETVLTDNGSQFTNRIKDQYAFKHIFDRVCQEHKIRHRLTKVNHPWTNGQVERMNRALKEATVKKYHYGSHQELAKHLNRFLDAYNFRKRLKSLRGSTPYEEIVKWWKNEPERFREQPHHHILGLYT